MGREIRRRHLAAQQHLIADHQRCNDAGMFLGQFDRNRNLGEVLDPVAGEPDPLDHLQPDLAASAGTWSSPFSIE